MKKTIFALLAGMTMMYSCQKEDSVVPETDAITKRTYPEEVFIAGGKQKAWITTHYFLNGQDVTYILFPECMVDNIQVLYRNGEFVEHEGASRCDPSNPDIYDFGSWSFNNDRTKLIMNTDNISHIEFDILELTPNSVKLENYMEGMGTIQIWLVPVRGFKLD